MNQSGRDKITIQFAAFTHVGRVRKRNEDACGIFPLAEDANRMQGQQQAGGSCSRDNLLVLVCDGMGGGNAGDYASHFVVEQLPRELRKRLEVDAPSSLQAIGDLLKEAVEETHFKLIEEARADEAKAGMGTTLSALWLRGNRVCIAQIGDSRTYRLREGRFEQLSVDQSRVGRLRASGQISEEESLEWAGKNEIEQALGMEERKLKVAIDFFEYRKGDLYLLCSDGLTDRMLSSDLQEIIAEAFSQSANLMGAAKKLILEGNRCSGRDNLTVLLLGEPDCAEIPTASQTEPARNPGTTSNKTSAMNQMLPDFIQKPVSRLFFGLFLTFLFLVTFVITLIFANLNSGRIAMLEAELDTLRADFDRMVSAVENVHDQRGDLEAELQTRFNTIDQRSAGLQSSVSELRSSLELQRIEIAALCGLASRVDGYDDRLEALTQKLDELEFALSETEESIQQQLVGRLMREVERINELSEMVEELRTQLKKDLP